MNAQSPPLCVDLDGTLIRSDLLVESLLELLKRNPLHLFSVIAWLLRGKAHLKEQVARRVDLDVAVLPYNRKLVDYLTAERATGRRLVLATSAHESQARKVAANLGLFDDVIASSNGENLTGSQKGKKLAALYGERGFDYAGNDYVDIEVWSHARQALLVSPPAGLRKRAEAVSQVQQVFEGGSSRVKAFLKAIRPHQWLKNVLILVPLLAAHQLDAPGLLLAVAVAFAAFCLCASSVYLLNDLLDLPADRQHPRKKSRPFAAGHLPLTQGIFWCVLFAIAGFVLAGTLLSRLFCAVLAGYYLLTLCYSLKLKQIVMLDVVVLAGLYTTRIIAGAVAISVFPSFWLLAFSMFLFLSLAMVKRYTELRSLVASGRSAAHGRGYRLEDISLVISLGGASGYLSVLVLALYINSPDGGAMLYSHPHYIWLLCPILLYWVSRVWFKAFRDAMHDDPLVFAVTDYVSLALAAVSALIIWKAI